LEEKMRNKRYDLLNIIFLFFAIIFLVLFIIAFIDWVILKVDGPEYLAESLVIGLLISIGLWNIKDKIQKGNY